MLRLGLLMTCNKSNLFIYIKPCVRETLASTWWEFPCNMGAILRLNVKVD